jgi:hypothetical protein
MADAKDIKLTENDLEIQNGDFVISKSDQQHIEDIVDAFQGYYKEFPLLGVGIRQFINASGVQAELQTNIQLQLESDGYSVNDIIINEAGNVFIDAERI